MRRTESCDGRLSSSQVTQIAKAERGDRPRVRSRLKSPHSCITSGTINGEISGKAVDARYEVFL